MLDIVYCNRVFLKEGDYPSSTDLEKLKELSSSVDVCLGLLDPNDWFTIAEKERYDPLGRAGGGVLGWIGPTSDPNVKYTFPGHKYVTVTFDLFVSDEEFSKFELVRTHLGKQIGYLENNKMTLSLLDIGTNFDRLLALVPQ